jgi:transposase-like protein
MKGEMSAQFAEVYGASVSRETVSKTTDQVLEEMGAWMIQPLDEAYPLVMCERATVLCRGLRASRGRTLGGPGRVRDG